MPVVGYESTYAVSDAGRVKRVESVVWNCKGYYLTRKERVLKPGNDRDGYQLVGLCQDGQRSTRKVHRLVLEAFVGPCPDGHQTRHLNGDKQDNSLGNLAWGTAAEQMADIEAHGNRHRGEAHHFYGRCGSDHWLADVST